MTNPENQDCLKNYQFIKTIGEGTFGKVKLSKHLLTNEFVAIKILEKSKITDKEELERVEKEIKYLKLFDHPNIIQLYEVIENDFNYYIVMEYIPNGEFFNYIVEKERIEEKEASFFYSQIIRGIEEINKKNICHRDIKPENLLLTKEKTIKIIDFGLSNEYIDVLNTQCGSPCYAAPEIIRGIKYNGLMVDIWASGIILFAMLFGYLPFDDKDNNILFRKILECNLEFPNDLEASFEAKDLIMRILNQNPDERIKLDEILKHPFLKYGNEQYRKMIKPLIFNKKQIIIDYMVYVLNYSNKNNEISKAVNENKHNGITTTYKLLKKQFVENKFNFKLFDEKMKHIKPYISPIKYLLVKPNNFNDSNRINNIKKFENKKHQMNIINNINIINNNITQRENLRKNSKDNNKINKAHSIDNTKPRGSKKIKNIKNKKLIDKKILINNNNINDLKKIYLNLFELKQKISQPKLDKLHIKKLGNIKKKMDTSVSVDRSKRKPKYYNKNKIAKTPQKYSKNPFQLEENEKYKYNHENKKFFYLPANLTNIIRGKSDDKIKINKKNKQYQIHKLNNNHLINNKIRIILTPINQNRYLKYRGLSTDIPNIPNKIKIKKDKYFFLLNKSTDKTEKTHSKQKSIFNRNINLKNLNNININRHKENIYHFKTISALDESNSILSTDRRNNKKMENIMRTPKDLFKQKIISSKYNTLQTSPNEKKNQYFINTNIICNNYQINNSENKNEMNKSRFNKEKNNYNVIGKINKNMHKNEYTPLIMKNKNQINDFKDLSMYSDKKRIVNTINVSNLNHPRKEIRRFYIRNENINPKLKKYNYISAIK